MSEALTILAGGVVAFGLACLVGAIGIGALAIALALFGVACVVASVGIFALIFAFASLVSAISLFLGGGLLEGLQSGFESFAGGFKSKLLGFLGGFGNDAKGEGNRIGSNVWEGVTEATEKGASDNESTITDSLKSPFDNFFNGEGVDIQNQGEEYSSDMMNMMATGFTDNSDVLSGSFEESLGGLDQVIDAETLEMYGFGADGANAVSSGLQSGGNNVNQSATGLLNGASGPLKGLGGILGGIGTQGGSQYTAGIRKGGSGAGTAASSMVSNARSSASGANYGWTSLGSDAGSGFASGIRNMIDSVASAAASMVRRAKSAAQAEQNSNSPSKDFMEFGNWAVEGYIIGLKAMGSDVEKAAGGMVKRGLDAVIDAMDKVYSSDFDFTPTITPVVDLTKVNEGASAVSSAFESAMIGTGSQAFNNLNAITNDFASNMNQSALLASNLGRLTNQLGLMTDTMNSRSLNNYITVDGSADPEAFADGLIRSFKLNARTT